MATDYKTILQSPPQLELIAAGLVILEYIILLSTGHGYFDWTTDSWIMAATLGLVYWSRYKADKPVTITVAKERLMFEPKHLTLLLLIVHSLYTFYYFSNGVGWLSLLKVAQAILYLLAFKQRTVHEPLMYQPLVAARIMPITIALVLCLWALHNEMAYMQMGGGYNSGLELQYGFEFEQSKGGYQWDYRYRPSMNYTPGTLVFFDGRELNYGFELTVALLYMLVMLALLRRPGTLFPKLLFGCLTAWWFFVADGPHSTDFSAIWVMLIGFVLLGVQAFFPEKLIGLFSKQKP